MTTNSPRSVHTLVRLLKSPTDPPSTPGPSKIEIACLAWSDPSFRATNKSEVIGEWILTLLGQAKKTREKDRDPTFNPIADSRYWTLFCAVLTTPPPTAARSTKTWLLPLLNRFQIDTIVTELLALRSSQVLGPARAALAVLWPLSEKKIGVEALADCLGTVLNTCTEQECVDDNLVWICSAVVATYRAALANTGNKKKLYHSFLTTHLPSWLCAISDNTSLVNLSFAKQLQESIYSAGTDTLFSLDALKQPLDTLFGALLPSISSFLPVLPKLCTSFLSATHRHRSVLFVSATNVGGKEEVRKRGMEFVRRCWNLIQENVNCQESFEAQKWRSIIGVLKIVEKERLFALHPIRGMHSDTTKDESGSELALTEIRDKAVEMLENVGASSNDHQAGRIVLSIQLLDVLVQIEYDFIGFVLQRVLSALISIPLQLPHPVVTASSEFLTHVLEYHTETRTVHTYTLALLGAVAASSTSPTSWTSRSMMANFSLACHLSVFARALRASLSPTQTIPLTTAVLQAVEVAWRAFKDVDEEARSPKKKFFGDTDKNGREARSVLVRAREFSFTGRVAGTILSNLPAGAYAKGEEYPLGHLWNDAGKLGWTIAWHCLSEKSENGHGMKCEEDRKRKHAVETGHHSAPYRHTVASAALRLLYDVRARVASPLGECDQLGERHIGMLLRVVWDETSDPELVLETVRTLLWHVWYTHTYESQEEMETQPIFTVTLNIISDCSLSHSEWSGVSTDLTRDNLGIAILYALTERWIDVFDALASTKSLERFVSLLLSASCDLSDDDDGYNSDETDPQRASVITLRGILLSLLRNAQFWELHNIRAVFLSSVLTLTASLSPYCFLTTGIESPPATTTMAHSELTLACSIYNLLLYVPSEYLTRSVRAELVKRAMAGDDQICLALEDAKAPKTKTNRKGRDGSDAGHQGKSSTDGLDDKISAEELNKWTRRLACVRIFLQRMAQFLGTPSPSTSLTFVSHILNPPPLSCLSKALTSVTLDLIQIHVVSLLRSQEPEAVASVSGIISMLTIAGSFARPRVREIWTQSVVQPSVLKLIECVTCDFDPSSLPDRVKRALETLLEVLDSDLSPYAKRLVENDDSELDRFLSNEQINAWSRMLSLRWWLGLGFQDVTIPLGLKLATSTMRNESPARPDLKTCSSVLELMFQELYCIADTICRAHLDVLVAFYAINGGDRGSDIEHTMDVHVTQASKRMSIEHFSRLLSVLEEGIGGSGFSAGRRERLIHLGQVMLHDAPQGTLRVIQHFVTRCFNLFADREKIYGGSSQLKLQYLEFIARHCSDRPAAIRSVDLGCIWPILNKILSGSSDHDAETALPIFHHIVTIIGALIRLRRDLVVHTLPHLSLTLRQLVMLTRKIRPQLGARQNKIVTDTFPSWLSASQPLSTDEARALARLLTSLTIKTIPRTHTYAPIESQKAESLAKPFAKHASYVLIAYVDAFNDPLCIINAEMRRDLEPGLFALCEMVGEHSRDALMVSALDSAGKTIMKSLWKAYEKQRYVGKG